MLLIASRDLFFIVKSAGEFCIQNVTLNFHHIEATTELLEIPHSFLFQQFNDFLRFVSDTAFHSEVEMFEFTKNC